jgi:hypothetical protein
LNLGFFKGGCHGDELRNLELFPDKVHNRMMDRKGSCLKKPLAEIAEF